MRIVIVEDASPIREGMGKILKKIGDSYEVVGTAPDGIEGLRLIDELRPDLVITDIRMPGMDGLTMLKEVRKLQIDCRFIVLTAYSDFNYAKEAIELGIENYLLKPIKIPELRRTLAQMEDVLSKQVTPGEVYPLNYIFRGALTGHLDLKRGLILDTYGFDPMDPAGLLMVWLGDAYDQYKDAAAGILENVGANSGDFDSYLIMAEDQPLLVDVIYHFAPDFPVEEYFAQKVAPMLSANTGHRAVYGWGFATELAGLKDTVREVYSCLEWNLMLDEGTLISGQKIGEVMTVPFKYPLELEQKVRVAISHKDQEEFKLCFRQLGNACREEPHSPEEIKEACIRYGLSVLSAAKEFGNLSEELSAQDLLKQISRAVTWEGIFHVLLALFDQVVLEPAKEGQEGMSLMVQKAQSLLQEYYSQGLTLEETARKLGISDEYLSAQFKKETGRTFSETMRLYRIDKIKKLLMESDLKLNQIAAMTGYSDPKYMSKVFREEVGMLPAEYRKMNR